MVIPVKYEDGRCSHHGVDLTDGNLFCFCVKKNEDKYVCTECGREFNVPKMEPRSYQHPKNCVRRETEYKTRRLSRRRRLKKRYIFQKDWENKGGE